jgi:hypothetical protein
MKNIPWTPAALATASLAITLGIAPVAASAAGLDGSSNMVCAATRVVACTKAGTCFEGEASTFDLVEFIFVDVKAKVVRARTQGDTRKEESPIRVLEKSSNQLILQGVENGHGWGMSIDQAGGRMTAAIAGESANFMIFGVCTAL